MKMRMISEAAAIAAGTALCKQRKEQVTQSFL
jgi:hypothetical protein